MLLRCGPVSDHDAPSESEAEGASLAERAGLTYDEVDEVLRRATEIEHGQGHAAGEGRISPRELEKLGGEIGLSSSAVRTALAEVSVRSLARTSGESRPIDRWFGPGRLGLQRTIGAPMAEVRAEVHSFMERQSFRVKRNFGERIVWEPASGLLHSMRRVLDFSKSARLSTDCEIETSIVPGAFSPNETDVRFVIDMQRTRDQGAGWSMAVASGLTAVGALTGVLALDALMVAVPALGGAALGSLGVFGTRHAYRREIERQHDILARFLDYLEHERPRAR